MRPQAPTRSAPARTAGLLILLALLLAGLPAYGQAIKVTSAVPDSGDQGVVGLVVTIGGENFASGAKVAFYVTGTTNPGGIAVKSVKYKDPKNLEATIDVAPDAQTDLKFDVQVKCGGRTGKGTELFKVNVKVTGNDTIPPGSVLDLSASFDSLNIATFSWTAPADDGYDASSGPAETRFFAVRAGYGPGTPGCGPFSEAVLGSAYDPGLDPCYVAGSPGDTRCSGSGAGATCTGNQSLAPDTEYWAIVRYCDDATPTANCSPLAEDLAHQLRLVTGPAPQTTWSVTIPDACPPLTHHTCSIRNWSMLDFDLAGNPAILYEKSGVKTLASWDGGGWRIEPVWPGISGAGYDFAFDPSGFATIAANVAAGSRVDVKYFRRTGATSAPWESETVTARVSLGAPTALAFNPMDGSPAILYVYLPKPGQGVPRLAERHGTTWSSQDVPLRWSHGARRTLAFDPAGNPAFTAIRDVDGVDDVAFAYRENGVWKVERVVGPPTDGVPWGYVHLSNGLAFDPVRGDFSAVCMPPSGPNGSDQVLFCERSAGTWTCEAIDAGFDIGPSLAIRADGSVFVAYGRSGARIVAHRSPGGTWEREYVDWNTGDSLTLIKLGPDGRPAISWFGAHDATGAGLSDSVCLAQRQ